jgi:hypothetical protein
VVSLAQAPILRLTAELILARAANSGEVRVRPTEDVSTM